MSLRSLLALLVCALALVSVGPAAAQDPTPATPQVATAVVDPSDEIVRHIDAVTKIVKDNRDNPDQVKTQLKAYIDQHGKEMKEAGDRFEAHLNTLPVDEAETYKETLQRKMEKSLADFLETMLDFSERHPEQAKELDELLQSVP